NDLIGISRHQPLVRRMSKKGVAEDHARMIARAKTYVKNRSTSLAEIAPHPRGRPSQAHRSFDPPRPLASASTAPALSHPPALSLSCHASRRGSSHLRRHTSASAPRPAPHS